MKLLCVFASLITVVFSVFSFALFNGFVSLDDSVHLLNNPLVRSLSFTNIFDIFQTTTSYLYVPLTVFSYAIEYYFIKLNPFFYHLTNILLHLGVVAEVFYLALLFRLSLRTAFFAALLFGVHPIHVESVVWITERKDVLYSFFYMLAIIFYIRHLRIKRASVYLLSVVFGFLSMLTKPMALSLPLVLLLFDWMEGKSLKDRIFINKLPYALYIIPIAWMTYSIHIRMPLLEFPQSFLIWVWSFSFYIVKFIVPFPLQPYYDYSKPISFENIHYFLSVFVFLYSILIVYIFRRHKWLVFAFVYYFFSIFFLLRMDVVRDFNIVADRFMYLPSLGFCLCFGYFIDLLLKNKKTKRITDVCLVCLFSVLLFQTKTQIAVWKDSFSLWDHIVQTTHHPLGYYNRGLYFYEKGDFKNALNDFNIAGIAFKDRTKSFGKNGTEVELREDIQELTLKLATDPTNYKLYWLRANVFARLRNTQAAFRDYEMAVELKPDFWEVYYSQAQLYRAQGQLDLALENYRHVLQLDPQNYPALFEIMATVSQSKIHMPN